MQYNVYLSASDIFKGYYEINDLEMSDDNLILAGKRMIADEDGRSSLKKGEELSSFNWARKELIMRDLSLDDALLIFLAYEYENNNQPLIIYINNNKVEFTSDKIKGYFLWRALDLPCNFLQKGVNDIVFTGTEPDSGWSLAVATGPGDVKRSYKSVDGGETWQADCIGYDNSLNGEYMVRLIVNTQKRSGSIVSPVFQDLHGKVKIMDFSIEVDIVNDNYQISKLDKRNCEFQIRSANYGKGLLNWSEWVNIKNGKIHFDGVDAIQWRILLEDEYNCPLALRGISYKINFSDKVSEYIQKEKVLVHPFEKTAHMQKLNYIIGRERLLDMLKPLESEFERFIALREWVSRQWRHHDGEPYPGWDPMIILEWLRNKKPNACGFCVIYSQLYYQLCLALGMIARPVVMTRTETMHDGGHFVTEVYSNEYNKWVVMDVDYNVHYELYGEPLNALELHNIFLERAEEKVVVRGDPSYHPMGYKDVRDLSKYLFFGVIPLEDVYNSIYKGPIEHGQGTYRWNGFLWWFDRFSPKQPQFSRYTNREQVLYCRPNLTKINNFSY